MKEIQQGYIVLNFRQLFLRTFLIVFSLLFLSLTLIIYFWVKDFYIQQTKVSLVNITKIVALTLPKTKNLDTLAKDIKDTLNVRLTLINFDGTVLAESHKDKKTMKNHKNREEILLANTQQYAHIIRYSHTLHKNFLYVVTKYKDDKYTLYIRVAKELKSINDYILLLGEKILSVLALLFVLVIFITYKISNKIQSEIDKIIDFLTSMTKKQKKSSIESHLSLEFYNLTRLLTKVSKILTKKEKQKSKFTAKLQLSNQQKDDIISAISHEFKNPIAVINGYAQTLIDDTDINQTIRQKFLTKIYNNGLKLSDLIDTLRLSGKLDSGQQEMRFKQVNIYELVQDSIESIHQSYANKEVIVEGDKTLSIECDPSLFGVVIVNLIENAFKYSEDEVHIRFTHDMISVIDTGIGISKNNLEKITDKFYRVNKNSWNNSLGLGLFIVSNILNLHHFRLEISSHENEGSTFSVKF